jgi:Cu2+-exporting ATPase
MENNKHDKDQQHETVAHEDMDHSKMDHSKMDHSKMDHSKMDHSKMDHSKMDHSKIQHDHGSIPMGKAGHDHHKMMIKDFKKRFWVSLFITIPVLILSPMIQQFFGYNLKVPGNAYVLMVLSSIIYFWGGWPFLKGFVTELKEKGPGMMTLIAMAISVAYFYSTATVFGLRDYVAGPLAGDEISFRSIQSFAVIGEYDAGRSP